MIDSKSKRIEPDRSEFLEYFKILRKRKWTIFLTLIFVIIPFVLWTFLMDPIYEAVATIIYEEPQDTMFALDMGQSFYSKSAIINMTERLKSRSLALEVVRSLPEEIIQTFKFPDPLPPDFSQEKFIARQLQENLSVVAVRGSDILKIKLQTNDPVSVTFIANTYIDRLMDWNLRKKLEEISNVRSFVEQQLAFFQNKLNDNEEALRNFKEENNIISLTDASTETNSRMTEAEIAYNTAKAEREVLEQRKIYLEKKKQEMNPSLSFAPSPLAQQLKTQLLQLETRYSTMQLQQGSNNQQDLIDLTQDIIQLKQNLVSELVNTAQRDNLIDPLSQFRNLLQESFTIDIEVETYKAREREYKKILDHFNLQLQKLPRQELKLARLIRTKVVNENIYSMLLEKREEARITEASKVGDVQIIDTAETPKDPIKPQKKRNLAVGIFLGLGLGITLAFFLESIDTTLKSQEDLEKYLGLTVLASIPKINPNNGLNISNKSKHTPESYSDKLLSTLEQKSPIYEAYRSLQINFAFINADHNIKTILMTSAGPGEGKTLSAINMAYSLGSSGYKTIILDTDLRRPMIHKVLNIKQEPGITDILIDKENLWHTVQKIDTNVSTIPSGTIPPNPSELLCSQKMKNLLTELKKDYDLIILDAPPVIAVTDSVILSREVDGVCLVVRSGKTIYDAALKAQNILESCNAKIVGSIINDVNIKQEYGYYKDYYYYQNNSKKSKKKSASAQHSKPQVRS